MGLSINLINDKLISQLIDAIQVLDFEYYLILEFFFRYIWLEVTKIYTKYI